MSFISFHCAVQMEASGGKVDTRDVRRFTGLKVTDGCWPKMAKLSVKCVTCFLVYSLIYNEMEKHLALTAETRVSGWPLFLAKRLFPHFQQASLPKMCSRGNVVSVDVTGSRQDFKSLEVPFQRGTSEVKSSKVSVNRLFTSEIRTLFGQILYLESSKYTVLSFHSCTHIELQSQYASPIVKCLHYESLPCIPEKYHLEGLQATVFNPLYLLDYTVSNRMIIFFPRNVYDG